jgi:polyisoprenoid-binding protein YceI
MPRSPFLQVIPPAAALGLGGLRWLLQGSGNLYTATAKRFYVPDPDLGWRISPSEPLWLGLEVLAMIAAIVIGFAIAAAIVRWRERKSGRPIRWLRIVGWALCGVPLIVPVLAFASGGRPSGGVDELPGAAGVQVATGEVGGAIDAPAGRYQVLAHDGSALSVHMSAGGEVFDARFASGLTGTLALDPHDLRQPITGTITAQAAVVDTGIALRSKHAREEYLHVDQFPTIGFTLGAISAAKQDGAGIAFRAKGTVALMGKTHAVEVTGSLKPVDAAASARLKVPMPALLVQADFTLAIRDTALAGDAGDFDGPDLPIHVSLVLVANR